MLRREKEIIISPRRSLSIYSLARWALRGIVVENSSNNNNHVIIITMYQLPTAICTLSSPSFSMLSSMVMVAKAVIGSVVACSVAVHHQSITITLLVSLQPSQSIQLVSSSCPMQCYVTLVHTNNNKSNHLHWISREPRTEAQQE